MIVIRNTQRTVTIDIDKLTHEFACILEIVGYRDFDLGIRITTNKTIRQFNNVYRHMDKPTDILSFPYHHKLKAGEKIKAHDEDDKNLGDIIISAEYVKARAEERNISFEELLRIICVHGVCHLLGYDHITDYDHRRMRAKEAFVLKKLHTRLD